MEALAAESDNQITQPAATSRLFEELKEHCREDLAAVDREIARVLESDTDLLNEVGRYIGNSEGKKLRPILMVLAAQACGADAAMARKVAASLELVHNATLLHDDVIDKSALRRGRPTINARFGEDIAILMADYLYSNAFDLALEALKPQVLQMICRVTSRMCEGEIFQIEKADELLTEEDYYRIIRAKTAYLFGACTGLGGVVGDAGAEKIEALTQFGIEFGLAFQITDDVLDYTASEEEFGKTIGTDISCGKQTLPLIRTLSTAGKREREALLRALRGGDVRRAIELVGANGGIEYALEAAARHSEGAIEALSIFEETPEIELLREIARHIVQRTN